MTMLFAVEANLSGRRSPDNSLRNQHIGRDAQALMQSADHGQRQRTLAVQDFVNAVAFANDRLKLRAHSLCENDLSHVQALVEFSNRCQPVRFLPYTGFWIRCTLVEKRNPEFRKFSGDVDNETIV